MDIFRQHTAAWIWPAGQRESVNQYIEFHHDVQLSTVESSATLSLCVDSNYVVHINGQFVNCGQFSDFPDHRSYDVLAVAEFLQVGTNTISITVNHIGEDFATHRRGPAGMMMVFANGKTIAVSGANTRYRSASAWRCGAITKVTGQLGFSFEYDARKADSDAFIAIGDDDIDFNTPAATQRPIAKLTIEPPCRTRLHARGVFRRNPNGPQRTLGETMSSDWLSAIPAAEMHNAAAWPIEFPNDGGVPIDAPVADHADGTYLVFDLKREQAGFLTLDLDASAGTVIEIAWGEHLDNLRVAADIGTRCFAARYICSGGRQQFTQAFQRIAGRYIQLHISHATQPTQLFYVGLRPTNYPVEHRGRFVASDRLLNRIYDVSTRTLELCMHEHYEDCPWREQALYANDSRNQALCGYTCFGEYAFPATSFDLLGKSLADDGYLQLTAPAAPPLTIPGFTMAWIAEVWEHMLYSGDRSAAAKLFPIVRTILDRAIGRLHDNSLLACEKDKYYWHFYDWAPGLSNCGTDFESLRFDAPLNMLFVWALDSAAKIAETLEDNDVALRYRNCADRVRAACHATFYDAKAGAYRTYVGEGWATHFAELTQSLAILNDIADAPLASQLREHLARRDATWVPTTLSQSVYKYDAILRNDPDRYAAGVLDHLVDAWSAMLYAGATSFWETQKGGADFDGAGSLCHGWSAIPIYVFHTRILGVQPAAVGWSSFTLQPLRGLVPHAEGTIPTPAGPIDIAIDCFDNRLRCRVTHPKAIACTAIGFTEDDTLEITTR